MWFTFADSLIPGPAIRSKFLPTLSIEFIVAAVPLSSMLIVEKAEVTVLIFKLPGEYSFTVNVFSSSDSLYGLLYV